MKFPFFKKLAIVSILLFAWNCSEEASVADNENGENIVADELPVRWTIVQDETTYIIVGNPDGFPVYNGAGDVVGAYDMESGAVITPENTILTTIDLSQCIQINPDLTTLHP
ncbi:MAG: hypothetical protein IKX06_03945, partial [Clostridia bacterium]|nr:hypothetical protein [Clostridia bacterium]